MRKKSGLKIATGVLLVTCAFSMGSSVAYAQQNDDSSGTNTPYTYFRSNDELTVTENYDGENGKGVRLTLNTEDKSRASFEYLNYVKTSDLNNFLTMGFEPSRVGQTDFDYLTVTLTDALDDEQTLTYAVSPQPESSSWYSVWSNAWISFTDDLVPTTKAAYGYMATLQVEGTQQLVIGRNSGAIPPTNPYYRGTYMDCGYFIGRKTAWFMRETEESKLNTLSFGLNGGISARINNTEIADLTNEKYLEMASENLTGTKYAERYAKERVSNLFSSGYVSLSVEFINVTSDSVSCYLTRIGEQNLSVNGSVADGEPYMGADVNTNVIKGIPYTLPVASAHNFRDGALSQTIDVRVKNIVTDTTVAVDNGRVVFPERGSYALIYTATDGRGNTFEKTYPVTCFEETPSTTFVCDAEYASEYATGDIVAIPAVKAYSDLSLRADKSVSTLTLLQKDGVVLEGYTDLQSPVDYRLEEGGRYELIFLYQDAFGQIQSESRVFTVKESVGIAPTVLPVTFTAGKGNTLCDFSVHNYIDDVDDGELYRAIYVNGTQVYLAQGARTVSGSLALSDTFFSTAGVAELTYKAGFSKEELPYAKSFTVPVIKPTYISDYVVPLDADGTPDHTGVTATNSRENVRFSTTADRRFLLPQYLPSDELNLEFGGDSTSVDFQFLRITLQNGYNGKTLYVDVYKDDELQSIVKVDGKNYTVSGSLLDDANYFQWTWSDEEKTFLDKTGAKLFESFSCYSDGTVFEGFDGAPISLSFSVCGVEEGKQGGFCLMRVLNQAFGSIVIENVAQPYQDRVAPVVRTDQKLSSKTVSIGTSASVPTARAYDVLDCFVKVTVKVIGPDQKEIFASNGEEEYEVLFAKFGIYQIVYTATASNALFTGTSAYIYTVKDWVKPLITVNGEVAERVRLGDTVTFPEGIAFDNVTQDCQCYIIVYTPYGERKVVNGTYTFERTGTYKVVYYAVDGEYNATEIVYTVTVNK